MLAITFRNLSNLAEISDYEYRVLVTAGDELRIVETGCVRGHARSDGWEQLVRRLLDTREINHGNDDEEPVPYQTSQERSRH